jgi:raffinose/stachyose/melibiose transport system substrate-binding protein
MKDAGCFQDGAAAGTFDDIDARFFSGRSYAAFIPGSLSVMFSGLPPFAGKTLKTEAFPGNTRVTADSNYALAMNKATKKKAAVAKFLAFAASAAGQKIYCDLTGALPLAFNKNTKLAPQYSDIAAMLKAGKTFSHPKTTWTGSAAVTIKLGTGIQGLLTGQTQVGKVLKTADSTW